MRSINEGLRKWVGCKSFCHASMVMRSTHRKLLGVLARTCHPSVGCEDSGWVWGLLASYFSKSHCACSQDAARDVGARLSLSFSFSLRSSMWDGLSTVRVGLPRSVHLETASQPHKHGHGMVSLIILDPDKLTVNINHHTP